MSRLQKIPVLMYHALTEERNAHTSPLHITVKMFSDQLQWLVANDYKSISMDELPVILSQDSNNKYCVISFDDGYRSLLDHAMPLLKEIGFTATLYLCTGITGHTNFSAMQEIDPLSIPSADMPLDWQQIKQLVENGWSIQAHSINHADHSKLDKKQLLHEMLGSKKIIEQQTGQQAKHYAFPFGKYSSLALQVLKQAGYSSAVTVHDGLCTAKSNIFRLPRLEMNIYDTESSFINKIETGYASAGKKLRSSVRDILFHNPAIKDLAKKIGGRNIN